MQDSHIMIHFPLSRFIPGLRVASALFLVFMIFSPFGQLLFSGEKTDKIGLRNGAGKVAGGGASVEKFSVEQLAGESGRRANSKPDPRSRRRKFRQE